MTAAESLSHAAELRSIGGSVVVSRAVVMERR
jgi:hypothetical protein